MLIVRLGLKHVAVSVTYFGIKKLFYEKSAELWSFALKWCKERETSLFPPPIRGVIKVRVFFT
jgi:hypothetical protein